MRKKDLSEVINGRAVISLYYHAKIKVGVGSELFQRILGASWCTSRICVVVTAFCKCGGCNYRECKGRLGE